jgi:hypothetical protein
MMKEKWGPLFNTAVKGNEAADTLASTGAQKPDPPTFTRLKDQETDLGVYIDGQWRDLSARRLIKSINNKVYKKGLKSKMCEGITTKDEVAWKVTWKSTHRPNYKDKKNLNLIHKMRMRRSAIGTHVWRMRNRTANAEEATNDEGAWCPLCKEAVEDVPHTLGKCDKTKEIREKALKKIYKIIDEAHGQATSIGVWVGDDSRRKAAILLGLLPKEWAGKAQRTSARNRKRKREEEGSSTARGTPPTPKPNQGTKRKRTDTHRQNNRRRNSSEQNTQEGEEQEERIVEEQNTNWMIEYTSEYARGTANIYRARAKLIIEKTETEHNRETGIDEENEEEEEATREHMEIEVEHDG